VGSHDLRERQNQLLCAPIWCTAFCLIPHALISSIGRQPSIGRPDNLEAGQQMTNQSFFDDVRYTNRYGIWMPVCR